MDSTTGAASIRTTRRPTRSGVERLDLDVAVPVVRHADGLGEPRAGIAADLDAGLPHQDLDLADVLLHDVAAPAQQRDQPLRIRVLRPPDVDREPRRSFGGRLRR